MTKPQSWFVILALFFVGLLGGLLAQQQFSGGQAVTVTGTFWQSTQPVSGTFWQSTQPVSLTSLPALAAGTALVGKTYPYTSCGTTQVESGSPVGFAAMPTSPTAIETSTTCLLTLVVSNTGSAAATYYFTDNQSTAINVIGSAANPISVQPGERDVYTFPNGAKFNTGIKADASASSVVYYLLGIQ